MWLVVRRSRGTGEARDGAADDLEFLRNVVAEGY